MKITYVYPYDPIKTPIEVDLDKDFIKVEVGTSNILVRLILKACEVKVFNNNDHGNFRSGALIGAMERSLILVFVILNQYEAIGFLIAAKSILRFSPDKGKPEDEKSEYVLAGTLVSLAVALCLGIVVTKIILKFS